MYDTAAGGGSGRRSRAVVLEAENDPFALPTGQSAKPIRGPRALVALGAYMPWAVFVVLLTLFTFAYPHAPVLVWLAAALAADAVIVGAWPPQGGVGGFRARERKDWFPLVVGLFALGAAIFCGAINATVMEPWIHVKYSQRHSDVLPSSNPLAYTGSGVLTFASGSKLDTDGAAGFLSWPYTYCAAPIRGPDGGGGQAAADTSAGAIGDAEVATPAGTAAAGNPIGFFAVGKDCCDSRGGFTCDDASDPEALSGLHIIGRDSDADGASFYHRAAQMAAAANDETAAPLPVLMVWSKNPESTARTSLHIAVVMYATLMILSLPAVFLARQLMMKASGAFGTAFIFGRSQAAARAAATAQRWNQRAKAP